MMRGLVVVVFASACGFHGKGVGPEDASVTGNEAVGDDDAPIDMAIADDATDGPIDMATMIDAPPTGSRQCPTDSHLRVCLRFDQNPLPGSVPNEGALPFNVAITGATSTPSMQDHGALVGLTSSIFVPGTSGVTGIRTIEMWVRLDVEPVMGAREGLADTDAQPGIGFFYYHDTVPPGGMGPKSHYLRCVMGNDQTPLYGPDHAIGLVNYHHVACVCNTTTLSLYFDGAEVATGNAGSCAEAPIGASGMTIGQNDAAGSASGSAWQGVIDGIRLWDVARTPAQIAAPDWN